MPRDIVAIGASAGGVEALLSVVGGLHRDFPASLLITLHLPAHYRSSLDAILTNAGPLTASFAVSGERLKKARIHLAPPGSHLLIDGEKIHLGEGPRENNARPAIDPMFRSIALCCGGRSIGVILTGTLCDGASGLWTLRQSGGLTLVQDPKDALFPEMPRNAVALSQPDHVCALADIPQLLESLVRQPAASNLPLPDRVRFEVDVARHGYDKMAKMDEIGFRSSLTCPDCGGALWEIDEGDVVRFRCHVGHAYTAEVLNIAGDEAIRRGLSAAQRGLEEKAALLSKMEERAHDKGHTDLAATWRERAGESHQQANAIMHAILRLDELTKVEE